MMFDDDEIKAAANRLRTAGWTRPADEQTSDDRALKKLRKVHKPAASIALQPLASDVKSAGIWLASNYTFDTPRPLRTFMADKFGLSFDDAGRAVAEAERLLGVSL